MNIKLYFNNLNEQEYPNLPFFTGYLAVLKSTTWDDFGFKTTFELYLVHYAPTGTSARTIGPLKIGFLGQQPSSSPISHEFYTDYFSKKLEDRLLDELPDNFFSLPEYESYYSDVNEFFSNEQNLINEYFLKIRDVLVNKLQAKILTENVFKKSLKRTMCFSSHEEFQWLYIKSRPIETFDSQIAQANKILDESYKEFIEDEIYIMLHGFLIATLENYLSYTFIKTVMSSDDLILKQAERDGKINKSKFTVQELVKGKELLKQKVEQSLQDMSFHNVETVIPMFKDVLGFNLQDLAWLVDAVEIRHDCAHRAGYTKQQEKIEISKESLTTLIEKIVIFVREIQEQVNILSEHLNQG